MQSDTPDIMKIASAGQHFDRFAAQHTELEAGTVERATVVEWVKRGWVIRVWTGQEEWRVTAQGREVLRRQGDGAGSAGRPAHSVA